ncbi:mannitol dehydrogenase family protein [Empedobacter brevis]|uniref:mannitol dehydrogenase family protein n=1 Tax=Empedobacter brevis TaxID=247 RepID=UPI0039B055EE
MDVIEYKYKKEDIKSGILHFGVGNFHRAHQAFYTNQLLNLGNHNHWGICGVSLMASDKKVTNALEAQNLDYTLSTFSSDGTEEVFSIGAINELISGLENPKAVIDKIADPDIKIISMTITEGGYNLDKITNEFNFDDKKISNDLVKENEPTTIFGFVARGLEKRKNNSNGGLTILSCDNLQHNGNVAEKSFMSFMKAYDEDLANWAETNVSFPNSMVDRITPGTSEADKERLNSKSGVNDGAPVYSEKFIQWVIEDNFIAGRPSWEEVGVQFTDDVSAYENMKLSLLNASHTLLSYPSFVKGYRAVDKAMNDADILDFVKLFMDVDVTPYVPSPEGIDLDSYKQTLVDRFSNSAVSDQLARLCYDGISKFPVYIIPNAKKMLQDGKDMTRIAFLVAVYRHYLKYKEDDKGVAYTVEEPWMTDDDKKLIASNVEEDFLTLSPFKSIDFKSSESFVKLYKDFVEKIQENGVEEVLKSII